MFIIFVIFVILCVVYLHTPHKEPICKICKDRKEIEVIVMGTDTNFAGVLPRWIVLPLCYLIGFL